MWTARVRGPHVIFMSSAHGTWPRNVCWGPQASPVPSIAPTSSCMTTLGRRPAPPEDGEEGVSSSLQGPSAPGGERPPVPGRGSCGSQLLLACISFREEAGTETSLGEEGLELQHSVPPRPPVELVGGSDFSLGPGKSRWLPIPHCAPLGPRGRAGNGARLSRNEKQLQEGGAVYLGGRVQLTKQWLLESATVAVVPRQALSGAGLGLAPNILFWGRAALWIQPQRLDSGKQ